MPTGQTEELVREEDTDSEPRALDALPRPHALTRELLEQLTATLEAIIRTPEVQDTALRRVRQSLVDSYKLADHLWPLAKEVSCPSDT